MQPWTKLSNPNVTNCWNCWHLMVLKSDFMTGLHWNLCSTGPYPQNSYLRRKEIIWMRRVYVAFARVEPHLWDYFFFFLLKQDSHFIVCLKPVVFGFYWNGGLSWIEGAMKLQLFKAFNYHTVIPIASTALCKKCKLWKKWKPHYRSSCFSKQQYQDAMRAHKAGRPVNLSDLPVPPGRNIILFRILYQLLG